MSALVGQTTVLVQLGVIGVIVSFQQIDTVAAGEAADGLESLDRVPDYVYTCTYQLV